MSKKNAMQQQKRTERGALVQKTALITGFSKRYVRYVLAGDYNNEYVFATYMTLLEEWNKLPDAVRKLVPFN